MTSRAADLASGARPWPYAVRYDVETEAEFDVLVVGGGIAGCHAELCTACNSCVDVCRCDVLAPSPGPGETPVLVYPDECWFCGCCIAHCPSPGAIRMEHPLCQRVGWKRKDTGEQFRIGMQDPPPADDRPPVGGWGPPTRGR